MLNSEESFKTNVFQVFLDCIVEIIKKIVIFRELDVTFGVFWRYSTFKNEEVQKQAGTLISLKWTCQRRIAIFKSSTFNLWNTFKLHILFSNVYIILRVFCGIHFQLLLSK